MYWLYYQETQTDPYEDAKGKSNIFSFTDQVKDALTKSLDPKRIQNFFLTLENDAKNLNTQIGNGLASNAKNIQNIMQNVYKEGLKYGFAFGDAKDYMEAIQTSSQRMMSFTSKNVENAIMLGKALGVGAKEVGQMYANFIKAGMSQETANRTLTKIMQDARKYGVDAGTLTKTVSDNIFKTQLYGFKDGVDGLTKMAIQAQRVGTSMDVAEKAAAKAFDPDQAIEMASSLQMLGGAGGAMGDVFGLMYDAQSDMGSLNDKILKSTASMVDFNSKTGEFKINPEMRRNMTQYAEAIGSTYEEVAKNATKYRKEQEIMSKIPLSAGYSEEDKSLISSLAEIGPNGKVQVTIPGTDELKDVTSLTTDEIKKLKDYQKEADKDPKEIAVDQLSVQKKMSNTLDEIKQQNIFQFSQGNISALLESTKKLTMYEGFKKDDKTTPQDESAITLTKEFESLFTKIKDNSNDIITPSLEAYKNIVDVNTTFITTITAGYTAMVSATVTLLKALPAVAGKKKNNDGITEDRDNNPETPEDFILPSGSNTMITADFGGMLKKIVPNNDDTLLGMPKESMDSLFKYANFGGEMNTMVPKEKSFDKNIQTLSQYVEQKIVTENTSNVKLGVEPISVNVKIEGTGLNKDDINKLVNQDDINTAVIEKLRSIFDETKLINAIPQL